MTISKHTPESPKEQPGTTPLKMFIDCVHNFKDFVEIEAREEYWLVVVVFVLFWGIVFGGSVRDRLVLNPPVGLVLGHMRARNQR